MERKTIGKFKVLELLGQGGMGAVYKAHDPVLDRFVAIKVMHTFIEGDKTNLERFYQEARTAVKLQHHNIVAVYEMGTDEQEHPYIVMEFVPGEDLSSLIKRRAFIPFEEKLRILIDLCLALDHAHRNHVIHRDIKPGNVRINDAGEVKVLDFGIAKVASLEMTRTGAQIGSPYYMSPEQVRGRQQIDGRSDIWAAGVILYEFLTYLRPFDAEDVQAIHYQIVHEPAPPLAEILPGCSGGLIAIFDKVLAKNRDQRFATAVEFADSLAEFLNSLPSERDSFQSDLQARQARLESLRIELDKTGFSENVDPSLFKVEMPEEAPEDYGELLSLGKEILDRIKRAEAEVARLRPLADLLELSRRQFSQRDHAACAESARRVLEISPNHPEALQISQACERALREIRLAEERRAKLETALSDAQACMARHEYQESLSHIAAALEIEPGNQAARRLQSAAEAGLERQLRFEQLRLKAQRCARDGDWEESLEAIAAALQLRPDDTRLPELRVAVEKSLARRRQLSELLETARRHLRESRFESALELLESALKLEPQNSEALEIRGQVAQALTRLKRVEELLEEARKARLEKDFHVAHKAAAEGLELEPAHSEFREIQVWAGAAIEKERQLNTLLERARRLLDNGEYDAALPPLSEALKLVPGQPEATRLKDAAEEGRKRRLEIDRLLPKAVAFKDAENPEGCAGVCNQILELDANHSEALALQKWARERLELQAKLGDLLAEALRLWRAGDVAASLEASERGLQLSPQHPELLETRRQAKLAIEKRRQLEEGLEETRQFLAAGEPRAALAKIESLLALEPTHPELLRFQSLAVDEAERQDAIRERLTRAAAMAESGKPAASRDLCDEILALAPGHAEALALKARMEEELSREQCRQALLAEARRALKAGRSESAASAAREGLKLDPGHAELEAIRKEAEETLQRERAAAALLDAARAALEREEFDTALERLRELLSLAPGHPQAERLRVEALRAKEIAGLLDEAGREESADRLEAALELVGQALRLDPAHEPALRRSRDLARSIESRRLVAKHLAAAEDFQKRKQTAEALKAVEAALAVSPSHAEAGRLRETLRLELRLQRQLVEARGKLKAGDLTGAGAILSEGLRLQPRHVELLELEARLAKLIEKRQHEIDLRLGVAREALGVGELDTAIKQADQILNTDPGHGEAQKLKSLAVEKREAAQRKAKRDAILAEARRFHQERNHRACLEASQRGLELDPNSEELLDLSRRAASAISLEEKSARVAHLLESARLKQKAGNLAGAERELQTLLQLDPQHAEALTLAQTVRESRLQRRAARRQLYRRATLGIAAALALLLMVVYLPSLFQTEVAPPIGSLVLNVVPWGHVDAIVPEAGGAAVGADCEEAPCVLSLPAGTYRVKVSHPRADKALEFVVTVKEGGLERVDQRFQNISYEEEIGMILKQ